MVAPPLDTPSLVRRALNKYAPVPHGHTELSRGILHWDITNYADKLDQSLNYNQLLSKEFSLAGHTWELTLNLTCADNGNFVGFFVNCKSAAAMPSDWEQCIIYSVRFENSSDPDSSEGVQLRYRLSKQSARVTNHYAFLRRNLTKRKLYNDLPVIQNDRFRVSVYMRTISDPTSSLWHQIDDAYDSFARTGYTGISAMHFDKWSYKGLTALLMTLYHLKPLRDAVLSIRGKDPIRDDEFGLWGMMEPVNSNFLTRRIAEVFHHIKTRITHAEAETVVQALLGKGFISAIYIPLGRFTRVMLERYVREIGMVVDNKHLFPLMCGIKQTTIMRLYNRTSMLEILDTLTDEDEEEPELSMVNPILLNIRGFYHLESALRNHFRVHMVKTNGQPPSTVIQIHDSVTRVEIAELPAVLFIDFQRFEKPFRPICLHKTDATVKFEEHLDMADALPPDTVLNTPTRYSLFAVFVHCGDTYWGAHASFMRPKMDQWYVFENELVFPIHQDIVFQRTDPEQYMTTVTPSQRQREILMAKPFRHAYMLVYIRDDQINNMLDI